jgi:uncharacterized membrane protein
MKKPKKPVKPPQVIPPDARGASESLIVRKEVKTAISFAGPIPPPNLLAQYNEIIPNGADRILAMAERQSSHREAMESAVVRGNLAAQQRGTIFAFIIAMTAILGGIWLIYIGKSTSGLVAIIGPLVSLATAFIVSKYEQRKERETKAVALATRRKQ